jgi:hypothetical protein
MNNEHLKLCQDFYNGRKEAIFRHFVGRRISVDVPKHERMTMGDFSFQNDIRVIQDTRVNFMPTAFDVVVTRKGEESPHDGMKKTVLAWLNSRNFGGGRTFWEALCGYYLTQENYGTLFLKLFVRGGEVNVQKMYSSDVEVVVDEKNYLSVKKYIFSWEETVTLEGGDMRVSQMKEVIDDAAYLSFRDGELLTEQAHSFGFIPVVKIIREEEEGSPYGRSGVTDLIEPQQNVNMALTKRVWATKYNSFRVWAPKEAGFVEPGTKIVISPGALSPIPIEAVGGDVDLSAVEHELNDALDHLYRLGSVPRKLREEIASATTSAKALNTLLEGLKRYTEKKLVYLRRGIEELIEKYILITYGTDVFKVTVSFPSLDREDPDHLLRRAQFLSDLGCTAEALKLLGFEETVLQQMMMEESDTRMRDEGDR